MTKQVKTKKTTFSITGLTISQYVIISNVISQLKDILTWDEGLQEYIDNGNFIYGLNEEDYQELLNMKI